MKKELYEEVKDKFESLKRSIPYLEKAVKTRSARAIENSVGYVAYRLHRLHKKATEKPTAEAINQLTNLIWWHKNQKNKEEEKRKFLSVNKLYSGWAGSYDEDPNLLIYLEEKSVGGFFGNVNGKDVLDYGCGTGRYAIPLAKKGANVTAIDFTEAMLRRAREKARKARVQIDFKKENITEYKSEKKFDLIISMLVLDHIKDLRKVVEVIDKVSKEGTEIVISNVHPELIRRDVDIKTGQGQGYLRDKQKTNQFYHSLEEYVDVFGERDFVLTKVKDLIFERKYWKIRKFKKFGGIKDKPIGILMKFEKRMK